MNSHKLMDVGGCLFYLSAGPSLNFLFLGDILWSLNYWPAESHNSTNCYAFKNTEFYYVTLLFNISKISCLPIFEYFHCCSCVVNTFGKQFVLSRSWDSADSTQSLQGWRRGEKIQQLTVTTVSCEKWQHHSTCCVTLGIFSSYSSSYCLDWECEISMKYLRENDLMDWNVTIIVHL